jgi:CRP/FNR family transcriptional regulator, cyclic AMP receptor protein
MVSSLRYAGMTAGGGVISAGTCGASAMTRTPANPANDRTLLTDCILFRGLAAEQRTALAKLAHIREFAAGESIFLMGSLHDSMMAVLRGAVKISVTNPDGRELLLAILHPGEVFGEIALLDGKERSADAVAITDCCLAGLERRDMMDFLERNPTAWRGLIEVLCARLRHTDEHLAEVALLHLPARIAKALLRVVAENPAPAQSPGSEVRLSQREIGAMVGASRESINKCFHEWRRKGVIRIGKGGITVVDMPALERLAKQE